MEFTAAHQAVLARCVGFRFKNPMSDNSIHTVGKILDHPHPALFRTELPNGKIILAHLSKPLAMAHATFETGGRVIVELSPFDFDQARILRAAE